MDNSEIKVDKNFKTWDKIRPKVFEILITALLSAAIAFFQTLITHWGQFDNPTINPEVAGGIGATLRTILIATKQKIC